MRKIIYSLGIASFLAMMTFTVTTSLTNPFYGMSEVALAQGSSSRTTGGDQECESTTLCVPGKVGGIDKVTGRFMCCHKDSNGTGKAKT